ncbi:MAG: D-glycero-beta-D-manno-heptose 1-phosphate adenylyltransferase [Oscillochloris sp.]|nr:D-glycero-beta-D-manno-heptose 1-phosphate adenylyltransferase [Oscillochloris sp.]
MSNNLSQVIDQFSGLRVAVIGDVMLDSYFAGSADRICREAPVPVVQIHGRDDQPGGAANTAANLAALGADVTLIGVIGSDEAGMRIMAALQQRRIATGGLIVEPQRATLAKTRISAAEQLLVRFDQGSTAALSAAAEQQLLRQLRAAFQHCDALVISDYGYGVLGSAAIQLIAELQAADPRVIVADSKRLRSYRRIGITAAKPNFDEAVQLLGPRSFDNTKDRCSAITAASERLLDGIGARIVAVTLDHDGGIILERGRPPYRTYTTPAPHTRAAGAGDTFVGALTLALAAGADTPNAAELAAAAARVVIGHNGTATCTQADLREQVAAAGVFCADRARLVERVVAYRRQGRRIAFANGCFDILHRGHIQLLNQAKALADVLIVAINSDDGVRRIKGPGRPVNRLDDRLQVLGALSSVDCLVAFDEETPAELLAVVQPDIFVKGGDYTRAQLPEAGLVEQYGGTIHIVPTISDHSTSSVIERIRREPGERAVGA